MRQGAGMIDAKLKRWSALLLLLAGLTVIAGLTPPAVLLLTDGPVELIRGKDVWRTTFFALPLLDSTLLLAILGLPQLVWFYIVAQIVTLARHYRAGRVFDRSNPPCFTRIGAALCVMGLTTAAALPLAAWMLYARGDCPWLADISPLAMLDPDLFLAGLFLYVVGSVMQRGAELQEAEKLTI